MNRSLLFLLGLALLVSACPKRTASTSSGTAENTDEAEGVLGSLYSPASSSQEAGSQPGVVLGDPSITGTPGGGIDQFAVVERVMSFYTPGLSSCYQEELHKSPKLSGEMAVSFVIAPDGSVARASSKHSTVESPVLEECLKKRLLRMRFPSPKDGGSVEVNYPLTLALATSDYVSPPERSGWLADLGQRTDSSILSGQYGNEFGPGGSGLGADRRLDSSSQEAGPQPGVERGNPIILGALDRSQIDQVVKSHLEQIRFCYDGGLNKNPKLFGKIVVKFVTAKNGSVSSAQTEVSTMKSPIVEECVNKEFLRMEFPLPEGGGIVIVKYPFVFNSAEAASDSTSSETPSSERSP
jgi:hypothetical protein